MATGFLLYEGYNSGALGDADFDVAVDIQAKLLTDYLDDVTRLAYVFGFDDVVLDETGETFDGWAKGYLDSGMDEHEPKYGIESRHFHISASGGNPSRKCKEAIALAVCQVMFYECAKRGVILSIEVN